jgi:hypothetical protein
MVSLRLLTQCSFLLLLFALMPGCCVVASVPVANLKTFSGAIKGQSLCPCQTCVQGVGCTNCSGGFSAAHPGCITTSNFQSTLYSYTASDSSSSINVIRLMWITGDLLWAGFRNVTLRVFVDGEAEEKIAFRLYESHALGFGWSQAEQRTWGTQQVGKGALFGGLYLTFPIPFASGFRVSAELDEIDRSLGFSHGIYFIVRGLENMPVVLSGGSIELPATARLHVHRTAGVFNKSSTVPLAATVNASGLVYYVTMLASSNSPHFLEGEFFAATDGDAEPLRLSSGTEDYFLSAQYFDAGEFQLPNSGCNHVSLACLDSIGDCRVAAYRLHDADPIVFQKQLLMYWVPGDPFWTVLPTAVDFTAWVYQWPSGG